MYITVKMLKADDVCLSQIGRFRQFFGERVEVTADSVEKAIDVGLDVGLLFINTEKQFAAIIDDFTFGNDFDNLPFDEAAGLALLTIAAEVDGGAG